MTDTAPPLWIADQVRNDAGNGSYPAGTRRGVSLPTLWILSCASMTDVARHCWFSWIYGRHRIGE